MPFISFPVIVWKCLPVAGLALLPFIFVNDAALIADLTLINHERIHLRQQAELFWLPFMLFYFFNYAVNLFRYPSTHDAYRNIVFEREAFAMESDPNYLERRKPFLFLKFFRRLPA